jgi:Tol biopolymer transport system component
MMIDTRAQRRQIGRRFTSHARRGAWRLLRGGPPGLLVALVLGVCLVLSACENLAAGGGHFRPVPGTNSGGATTLAVNQDSHFHGHIAFIRNHQLYILDGKTGAMRALPAGANVQDPAYSPDGTRLAYISRGANWSDVMVISTAGGQPTALTHNQGTGQSITCASGVSESDGVWAADPVWAADGAALYYLSDQQKLKLACGFFDMAVWQVSTGGSTPQLVLWPARGENPTNAPGAGGDANLSLRPGAHQELAYTHYAYNATQPGESLQVQLFLATLKDQKETPLSPPLVGGTPEQALEPAWSPDGHMLAYIRRSGTSDDLYVMSVSNPASGAPNFNDYATATRLLGGYLSQPVWSPDGKALLYLSLKENEYNLYLAQLSVDGSSISIQGNPIQLTQGGVDGDSHPSWTGA